MSHVLRPQGGDLVVSTLISSNPGEEPGFAAYAIVLIASPVDNNDTPLGDPTGFKVGFTQNLWYPRFRGLYENGDYLVSSLEGQPRLMDKENSSLVEPWYQTSEPVVFEVPSSDEDGVISSTIGMNDTPTVGVPITLDMGRSVEAADELVVAIDAELNATIEVVVFANGLYTRQAEAEWSVNYSGTITRDSLHQWSPIQSTGIQIPTSWTEVSNGSRPITAGPTVNDSLANMRFARVTR